jgi:4-diphosphocytidyl-2-C-methyl-D-erythritol kinase
MAGLTETAYAKINLALHVRKRRADGYHELESLFAFAEAGDRLTLTGEGEWGLSVSGPFADDLNMSKTAVTQSRHPGEGRGRWQEESTVAAHISAAPAFAELTQPQNLVLRAARGMAAHFGIAAGIQFHLEKNLPVASGIGGGSADAAAAMRLCARHWNIDPADPALFAIARALGADVPACHVSRLVRGEGVGEILTPIAGDGLAGTPVLLVNPRVPLGTAEVFREWDGLDRGPLASGDPLSAALQGRNDLTAPASRLVPEIAEVLAFLEALSGVTLARMSGSGATCFALFETIAAREVGTAMVQLAMPDCWAMASTLR